MAKFPTSKTKREALAKQIGQDGFALLDALDQPGISPHILESQQQGVNLNGPVRPDSSWQAREQTGIAQATRAFGLRRTHFIGEEKTRFQHFATASAINLARLVNWFTGTPRATTRVSPFAELATVSFC